MYPAKLEYTLTLKYQAFRVDQIRNRRSEGKTEKLDLQRPVFSNKKFLLFIFPKKIIYLP